MHIRMERLGIVRQSRIQSIAVLAILVLVHVFQLPIKLKIKTFHLNKIYCHDIHHIKVYILEEIKRLMPNGEWIKWLKCLKIKPSIVIVSKQCGNGNDWRTNFVSLALIVIQSSVGVGRGVHFLWLSEIFNLLLLVVFFGEWFFVSLAWIRWKIDSTIVVNVCSIQFWSDIFHFRFRFVYILFM